MKIKIENTYEDGHESETTEEIAEFAGDPTDEEAVEEYLLEFTGDGHGADYPSLGSYHEITIIESEHKALVGKTFEWG